MIHVQHSDEIVLLRLRHGKANALDPELCQSLTAEIGHAAESGARALVLIGEGKMFSAGVDLKRLLASGRNYIQRLLPAMNRLFESLFFCPLPVVAAINGHAVAGGCILACAADRRLVAAGSARLGVPELQVGVAFPPVAVEIMRNALPPRHFAEVLLLGETFKPEAAHAYGLVDRVVPAEELLAEAEAEARRLGAINPEAFALTKRQMRAPARTRLDRGLATEASVQLCWETDLTREHIEAYVERTLG